MKVININSNSIEDIKEQRRAFISVLVGNAVIGVDGLIDRYAHKIHFRDIINEHLHNHEPIEREDDLSPTTLLFGAMNLNLNSNGLVSFVVHDGICPASDTNAAYDMEEITCGFIEYLQSIFDHIYIEEIDVPYKIDQAQMAEKFFFVNLACLDEIPHDLYVPVLYPLEASVIDKMKERLGHVALFDFDIRNIILKDNSDKNVLGCFLYLEPK